MAGKRDDILKAYSQLKGIIKKFTKDKGWQGENACKDGLHLLDELYCATLKKTKDVDIEPEDLKEEKESKGIRFKDPDMIRFYNQNKDKKIPFCVRYMGGGSSGRLELVLMDKETCDNCFSDVCEKSGNYKGRGIT